MGAEKVLVESVWGTCTHCTSWLLRGRVCLLQRGFSFGTGNSHRPNHWHIDAEVPTSSKALGWLGWDPPNGMDPFFDGSPLLTRILVDKCLMVHVWCAMLQLPVWSCFESHQSWYRTLCRCAPMKPHETTSSAQFWLFSPNLDAASTDTMLLRISLLLIAVASEEGKWPGCLEGGIAYTNLLEPWWISKNRLSPTGTKDTNHQFELSDCSWLFHGSSVYDCSSCYALGACTSHDFVD